MQMYTGLPIITNKIPEAERRGIPHHLLNHIPLDRETWVVDDFRRAATALMSDIRARGKLPIVVGGTHYYVNALLFEDRLVGRPEESPADFPELEEPTDVMLARLREVDPVMAARWHPNDRRKIRRSLEIFLRTGRRASDIYAQQRRKDTEGGAADDRAAGPWETLLLWVYTDPEVLKPRLDARVDKMLETGLMAEVRDLHAYLKAQRAAGADVDLTRGIWHSIGFKEFQRYLEAADEATASASGNDEKTLEALKAAAVEDVKTATRQYGKYQTRWIRRKIVPLLADEHPRAPDHLFLLDSSDIPSWSRAVADPAADVTARFLTGAELPDPLAVAGTEGAAVLRGPEGEAEEVPCRRECDVCGVTVVFESKWQEHLRSYRHRRTVRKRRKLALVPVAGADEVGTGAEGGSGTLSREERRGSTPDLSFINPP